MFSCKDSEDARTHYIHFSEKNSNCYKDLIYFKNYLIGYLEYMKKYQDLKIDLANKYSDNRKLYTNGKHDFIINVLNLAKGEYDD